MLEDSLRETVANTQRSILPEFNTPQGLRNYAELESSHFEEGLAGLSSAWFSKTKLATRRCMKNQ
jgi:hypothetical protein